MFNYTVQWIHYSPVPPAHKWRMPFPVIPDRQEQFISATGVGCIYRKIMEKMEKNSLWRWLEKQRKF